MQFHSAAAMFPMLGEDEFSALVEDIRVHGLVEPIWTFENRILDGRNRYKACTVAGVKPSYRVWKGADPFAFVVSENLRRRHLDAGQRAAIAVKSVLPRFEREAKERMRQGGKGVPTLAPLTKARDQAAAMFQVAHGYISDAKRVQAADPALLDRIVGWRPIPRGFPKGVFMAWNGLCSTATCLTTSGFTSGMAALMPRSFIPMTASLARE